MDGDVVCDEEEVLGCMDEAYCNYNPMATDDDGSCYNVTATVTNYSFEYQMVEVITDASNATYDWYLAGDLLDEQSAELVPLANGDYSIVVTDDQGCSVTVEFTVAEVSLFELSNIQLEVYPNPATNKLHLVINHNFEKLTIEVMNTLGAIVIDAELSNVSPEDIVELNISSIPNGMYILKVSTKDELTTIPWIKR